MFPNVTQFKATFSHRADIVESLGRRPRVLMISSRPPWPLTNGGFQRTNLLYRALASVADVDLALVRFDLEDELRATLTRDFGLVAHTADSATAAACWRRDSWLQRVLPESATLFLRYEVSPAAREEVGRLCREIDYDVVVCRYLQSLVQCDLPQSLPVILDIDDLDDERRQSRLSQPDLSWRTQLRLRSETMLLRRLVARHSKRCDRIWVTKPDDLQRFSKKKGAILPNIPHSDVCPDRPLAPAEASQRLLFVGSLGYDINVRAIDRFLERVWPRVLAQIPTAYFDLVGSAGAPRKLEGWSRHPRVRVLGLVEDLVDAYAPCAFTICPIWEGAGTKIKVLESLLLGRTCVVSRHSLRGYEDVLAHHRELCIAEDDLSFADECVRLLRNAKLRKTLAQSGCEAVRNKFSFASFQAQVEATLRAVCNL